MKSIFYVMGFCLATTTAASAVAAAGELNLVPTYQSRHYPFKHATGFLPTEKGREFKANSPHKSFIAARLPSPALIVCAATQAQWRIKAHVEAAGIFHSPASCVEHGSWRVRTRTTLL